MSISFVDIHNHLIPGVDDGARNLEQALEAVTAMREQGIHRIVATPHLDASATLRPDFLAKRLADFDAGWDILHPAAEARFPDVEIQRGNEIMLDQPTVNVSDARVRLAGGNSVLVEFPRMFVPMGSVDALYQLRLAGYQPIVAHPERYVNLESADLSLVEEWRRVGARMIVNAGSLSGGFGSGASKTVREMLNRGWVDLIGSDFHARPGRPLKMRDAFEQLVRAGGAEQAELLLSVNPGRAMDGEPLEPVPPLAIGGGVVARARRLFSFGRGR